MNRCLQILGGNSWGGGCALIKEFVTYMIAEGWEVHLLSSHEEVIQKMSSVKGLKILTDIHVPRDISPKQDLKALKQIKELCRREGYDVVHTYNTMPGLVGRTAARLAKVPTILHHQAGWNIGPFNSKLKNIVFFFGEIWGMLVSTKSICCSHTIRKQADQYRLSPKSRLTVVCNGIDPQPFVVAKEGQVRQAFRAQHGLSESAVVVGCHGRLSDLKNNATLVRAMSIVRERLPQQEVQLALAGEGSERENLQGLINELGLEKEVKLLGYTTEVPEFLASCDIFAMASLREGMSIAIMEAMAASLPIVCSDIPQNTELINDESVGFSVAANDHQAFADKIIQLVNVPEDAKAKGANAHVRLVTHYSLRQFLENTAVLYERPSGSVSIIQQETRAT